MKIAVLGCGYWGPNLVRNFFQLNKVDELYCCDPDTEKLDQIGVETYKGVVQLSGFVNNQKAVDKAVQIAGSVQGVKSVKNDLIVK